MKLQVILLLHVTVAVVRARPSLLTSAPEEHCSVNWYSESFLTKEVSYGNCVYSNSQDKCDKGLSMAVDKGTCAQGISRLQFPFLLNCFQLADLKFPRIFLLACTVLY